MKSGLSLADLYPELALKYEMIVDALTKKMLKRGYRREDLVVKTISHETHVIADTFLFLDETIAVVPAPWVEFRDTYGITTA
jgi:hypothetical protein